MAPSCFERKQVQNRHFSLTTHSTARKMDLMRQRDMQHHTYADYLIWSASSGNEVIRIAAGRYAQPAVHKLTGPTAMTAIPGISIDWDCLLFDR